MNWKRWKIEPTGDSVRIDPGNSGHVYLRPRECEEFALALLKAAVFARIEKEKPGALRMMLEPDKTT